MGEHAGVGLVLEKSIIQIPHFPDLSYITSRELPIS